MKVKCCYCGAEWNNNKKLPPTLPPGTVSHGICKKCVPIANAEVDRLLKQKKGELR